MEPTCGLVARAADQDGSDASEGDSIKSLRETLPVDTIRISQQIHIFRSLWDLFPEPLVKNFPTSRTSEVRFNFPQRRI